MGFPPGRGWRRERILRCNFHHHNRMGGDFSGVIAVERAEILMGPEVAHLCRKVIGIGDVFPENADLGFVCAAIEENHSSASIAERSGPNLEITVFPDAAT